MEKTTFKSLLISPITTIKEVMNKLNETAKKILFVTDENYKLLGTVTDGDIRRSIIDGLQLTITVQKIMRINFISINKNCSNSQEEARELMQRYGIEYIPIIDDDGRIIDIISWIDFFGSGDNYQEVSPLQNSIVIMAGGKGTRLDPFTKILPKPLIPLGNKPIIEHIMNRFHKKGFCKFILILNYKKEIIKSYFTENNLPYDIEFIQETDYYGTAGGLYLLKNKLNNTFVVTNCDTILEGDYKDFFNWHKEKHNLLTIVGSHREVVVPYGVLNMTNGSFVDISEKPRFDLFINTGTYVFEHEILDLLNENESIDMDKLIIRAKKRYADKVGVYPHWGGWFDIGQWDEYRRSLKHMEGLEDNV